MNKDKILKLLKENSGEFISGERISEFLGITRGGVWKSIKSLRSDGYMIESVTNKGYRLINNVCRLSEAAVRANMGASQLGSRLVYCDTVTSTFDTLAGLEPSEGLTVLAAHQTNGRGRLGRSWASNEGGIYFSFLLLPPIEAETAPFITLICALGVYRALSRYAKCGIKWPNDIVSDGKKLCGILTKTNLCESDIESVAVGIGVNANITSFAKELTNATSLKLICKKDIDENKLFAEIINEIDNAYYHMKRSEVLAEYKKACVNLLSEVAVHFKDGRETVRGTCTDILPDGSINVDLGDKTINVNSGEVSVRGIYGYA